MNNGMNSLISKIMQTVNRESRNVFDHLGIIWKIRIGKLMHFGCTQCFEKDLLI